MSERKHVWLIEQPPFSKNYCVREGHPVDWHPTICKGPYNAWPMYAVEPGERVLSREQLRAAFEKHALAIRHDEKNDLKWSAYSDVVERELFGEAKP